MNYKAGKSGFTLVEILVATAIIVAIVSMVYGSYCATSSSAQACNARIAVLQQGRSVLTQMARQIRCSYVGPAKENHPYPPEPPELISPQVKTAPENNVNYFNANTDDPGGEILHLVTTNSLLRSQETASGLFEVTYKFNKSTGLLSLSQERFTAAPVSVVQKRDWQPIAGNIRFVELTFFDGQQWLRKWDFKNEKKLPYAVKIEIGVEGENYQMYRYGTIAYVHCQNNQSKQTQYDMLASVNRQ